MGQDLFHQRSSARQVFERVQDATGIDIARLCFDSDEETLRKTQNAQIALYTCGLAAYHSLLEECSELPITAAAGHSVGEYAALATAGAFSIEAGAKLVQKRGDLMSRAGNLRPGTMAAVLGLERSALEDALRQVKSGIVVVANDNCPGQLVISGDIDAVQEATAIASDRGAKRVLPLSVSGAFHSPLMEESAESMRVALEQTSWSQTQIPVYSNVTAEPGTTWTDLLEQQLKSPVQWTETIQTMIDAGIHTFIECGAGEVLTGLLRRIDKSAVGLRVLDSATLSETCQSLLNQQS